jgi:hypothetical protein
MLDFIRDNLDEYLEFLKEIYSDRIKRNYLFLLLFLVESIILLYALFFIYTAITK